MLRSPGRYRVPLCWSPGIKFHFWKHLDVHIGHEVTHIWSCHFTKSLKKNVYHSRMQQMTGFFLHKWKRQNLIKGADIENVWKISPQSEHAHPSPSQGVLHTWPPTSQPQCWPPIGWGRSPVLLFYSPVSPSRSKDRCTVCSSPRAVRRRGISALPAWTWNLYCRRLSHHHTASPVVHPPCLSPRRRPPVEPSSLLVPWTSKRSTEERPGFTSSEAEAKGELKFVVFSLCFFQALCSCVYECAGLAQEITFLFEVCGWFSFVCRHWGVKWWMCSTFTEDHTFVTF